MKEIIMESMSFNPLCKGTFTKVLALVQQISFYFSYCQIPKSGNTRNETIFSFFKNLNFLEKTGC